MAILVNAFSNNVLRQKIAGSNSVSADTSFFVIYILCDCWLVKIIKKIVSLFR